MTTSLSHRPKQDIVQYTQTKGGRRLVEKFVKLRSLKNLLTSVPNNDVLEQVSVRHVAKGPRSLHVSSKKAVFEVALALSV